MGLLKSGLFSFLLLCASGLFAQSRVWLDKKGRWTSDRTRIAQFAWVEKLPNGLIKADVFNLDSVCLETTHYSAYADAFADRVREGLHVVRFADGTDSLVVNYHNNRICGQRMVYYPNHALKEQASYSDGKRNGKRLMYYENGSLRRDEFYQEGKLKEGHLYAENGEEMAFEPSFVSPQFPGGEAVLMQYLAANVKYPDDAVKERIQGRVIIRLVIDKDGTVTDMEFLKKVHPSLDKEAMRIVEKMAAEYKWIPGRVEGKVVRVSYNFPVSFRL